MTTRTSGSQTFDKSDQRYFPRWEVADRVRYELWPYSESHHALTNDLSCAGASLSISQRLVPNQKIKMTIFLSDRTSVELTGTIVWARDAGDERQVGVSFFNTSESTQEVMLKYAFNLDKKKYLDHVFKGWSGT